MTGRRLKLAGLVAFTACNAPAVETAAAPPAPDTAAIRTELQALSDRTEASYLAGDAAAVAATYADSAIAEFQGFPTAIGRPAIESSYAQYFAANQLTVAEITIGSVSPRGVQRWRAEPKRRCRRVRRAGCRGRCQPS